MLLLLPLVPISIPVCSFRPTTHKLGPLNPGEALALKAMEVSLLLDWLVTAAGWSGELELMVVVLVQSAVAAAAQGLISSLLVLLLLCSFS